VGYGVKHAQRKYESGVQEVKARWEHIPTPIESILSSMISRFPFVPPTFGLEKLFQNLLNNDIGQVENINNK
jgi:hypothetical protein